MIGELAAHVAARARCLAAAALEAEVFIQVRLFCAILFMGASRYGKEEDRMVTFQPLSFSPLSLTHNNTVTYALIPAPSSFSVPPFRSSVVFISPPPPLPPILVIPFHLGLR